MVLNLRTPKFRNFTFAELREDVVVILIIMGVFPRVCQLFPLEAKHFPLEEKYY